MRISFNSAYCATPFKGINEAVNKIREQIENGKFSAGDTFTKSQDGGTVIIENYYEKGQSSDINPQSSKGGAAVEGAVSGTTTGTAIEGTKSVAEKMKTKEGIKTEKSTDTVDSDDSTQVDLLDENDLQNGEVNNIIDDNNLQENAPDIDSEHIGAYDIDDNNLDIDNPDIDIPEIEGPEIEAPDIDVADIDVSDIDVSDIL